MSTALTKTQQNGAADVMEAVIAKGDIGKLTPEERVAYYGSTCASLGLNPLTQPFQYISLNGKLTLYATRSASDQLRKLHGVSIRVVSNEIVDDLCIVTVEATDQSGRVDTEIGAVTVAGLRGEALANARMKALTKAKRRATLSLVGLGWLDETEVDSIPTARPATVDVTTGEILDERPARPAPTVRALPQPSTEEGNRLAVQRKLFAVAKGKLAEEDLKALVYLSCGVSSTKDADTADLERLVAAIEVATEKSAGQLVERARTIAAAATIDEVVAFDDQVKSAKTLLEPFRVVLRAVAKHRIEELMLDAAETDGDFDHPSDEPYEPSEAPF